MKRVAKQRSGNSATPNQPTPSNDQQNESRAQDRTDLSRLVETVRPYSEVVGFIATVSIPFFAVRVIAAAGWNQSVALAIVTNSTLSDFAAAIIVLTMPAALTTAAVWLAMEVATSEVKVQKSLFLLGILGYLLLISESWAAIALNLGYPIAMLITAMLAVRGSRGRKPTRRISG